MLYARVSRVAVSRVYTWVLNTYVWVLHAYVRVLGVKCIRTGVEGGSIEGM
jgi:hypothetical protein